MKEEVFVATKYVGFEPELEFLAKIVDLFESTPMDDAMRGRAMRYINDRYGAGTDQNQESGHE